MAREDGSVVRNAESLRGLECFQVPPPALEPCRRLEAKFRRLSESLLNKLVVRYDIEDTAIQFVEQRLGDHHANERLAAARIHLNDYI